MPPLRDERAAPLTADLTSTAVVRICLNITPWTWPVAEADEREISNCFCCCCSRTCFLKGCGVSKHHGNPSLFLLLYGKIKYRAKIALMNYTVSRIRILVNLASTAVLTEAAYDG